MLRYLPELWRIAFAVGVFWAILDTTVNRQTADIRALTDKIGLLEDRLRDVEKAVAVSSALIERQGIRFSGGKKQ